MSSRGEKKNTKEEGQRHRSNLAFITPMYPAATASGNATMCQWVLIKFKEARKNNSVIWAVISANGAA